ncbi:cytochrome P450 [Bimuria novae-zelandiae CBS 107.79]|uniref:Cytochrome P450 n=1 Tax=Bimuria novae-zelandiae CBS 107.79 TaxID=1447943 RepID=A0A6A5VDF0_9PLEO|nr:cytochrome P450 [Bimuria novae-zelandiae CBS 107.79]
MLCTCSQYCSTSVAVIVSRSGRHSTCDNLNKSKFYGTWVRHENDYNTLNTTDVEIHAKKRRLSNLAFTDQTVKSAEPFMAEHITKSPAISLILWLKPRGLNSMIDAVTPSAVKSYYEFVAQNVNQRWEQHQRGKKVVRRDISHYLCSAIDPDTRKPAFTKESVLGEANLLIIAGTDTSATALCSFFFFFFYICKHPAVYKKVVSEIRTSFNSVDEIRSGPKLASCTYVRACIDEAMRMCPSEPSEFERVVRLGGTIIDGVFYPEGIVVGSPNWAWNYSQEQYGDPHTYRPERWLVTEDNPLEKVNEMKRVFLPFIKGPGNCRLDCRIAPGTSLGEGSPELEWGRNQDEYQLDDAYIALKTGPMIQFKKREE